jgi:hypothetical protein
LHEKTTPVNSGVGVFYNTSGLVVYINATGCLKSIVLSVYRKLEPLRTGCLPNNT